MEASCEVRPHRRSPSGFFALNLKKAPSGPDSAAPLDTVSDPERRFSFFREPAEAQNHFTHHGETESQTQENATVKLFISLSAIAAAISLSSCAQNSGKFMVGSKVSGHFGATTTEIITKADRMELFRLDSDVEFHKDDERIAGLAKIREQVKTPVEKWQHELVQLLMNDSSYEWDIGKGCEPMSGVLARFHRGEQSVDVSFCFQCRMLSMAPKGSETWEDFDQITGQLTRLMKEAFPADQQIQEL